MKANNLKSKQKGQLFSIDAITAIGLFLLLISAVMLANSSLTNKINSTIIYRTMEQKAEFITDNVYKNITTASKFDEEKTINFFQKNYTELNEEYDIGFNYSIQIINAQTNQVITLQGTQLKIGQNAQKPNYLITATRFGYLNNTDAKLVMKVSYYESK